MNEVISVKNLYKSFVLPKKGGYLNALNDVSFSVQKGEIFGILGPNGAGKSTTLEIIEGLKHQDSGKVDILEWDNIQNSREIKRHIGVQLQSSEYLPNLTLKELLRLFASLYRPKKNDSKQASGPALLKLVNLQEKENEFVKNLSGGQKQRFTIASSLVNDPEILFLDEPTTGIDPAARRNLWKLIKDLNKTGITIVLTTHYMEEAEYLCHRVAIMDEGKILKIDEPKRLVEDLAHTTQISFLVEKEIDENIFQNLPQIEKIYNTYPKVIVEIKSLEHVGLIIETLKNNHIPFSGFTLKTASLEDVYLDLTGKEYQE